MKEMLQKEAWPLLGLAKFFGVPLKTVEEDVGHIEKSASSEYKLLVNPPECEACGFVFRKDKKKRPSRCPQCKSERITEPTVRLVEK